MAELPVGVRFKVTEVNEFKVGRTIIARYRPEFDYRVTDLNIDHVTALVEAKKAFVIGVGNPRRYAGSISVKR